MPHNTQNHKLPLSHHKGVNKWYKLIPTGKTVNGKPLYKQQYFGKVGATFDEAFREYQDFCNPVKSINTVDGFIVDLDLQPGISPETLKRLQTDNAFLFDSILKRLESARNLPEAEKTKTLQSIAHWMLSTFQTQNDKQPTTQKLTGAKLSEVLAFWKRTRKPDIEHERKCSQRFNDFIGIIGDIHLVVLSVDSIRLYLAQLIKQGLSAKNRSHHVREVKLILNFLLKPRAIQATDYEYIRQSLPTDLRSLTTMLSVDSDEITDPDEKHTSPFPPDDFRKITAAIIKAGDKQFLAIWYLAVQTGCNLTDFARLTWDKTLIVEQDNGSIPQFRLTRLKRGKGKRFIPLLPETVAAIKAYRATLKPEKQASGQLAFLRQGKINRNLAVSPDGIRDSFEEYRQAAGVDGKWTYKHLRNVGANVRVAENLPIDIAWAFLGHTHKLGEAQKYEYAEASRLLPLVNAIASRYLTPLPDQKSAEKKTAKKPTSKSKGKTSSKKTTPKR